MRSLKMVVLIRSVCILISFLHTPSPPAPKATTAESVLFCLFSSHSSWLSGNVKKLDSSPTPLVVHKLHYGKTSSHKLSFLFTFSATFCPFSACSLHNAFTCPLSFLPLFLLFEKRRQTRRSDKRAARALPALFPI